MKISTILFSIFLLSCAPEETKEIIQPQNCSSCKEMISIDQSQIIPCDQTEIDKFFNYRNCGCKNNDVKITGDSCKTCLDQMCNGKYINTNPDEACEGCIVDLCQKEFDECLK